MSVLIHLENFLAKRGRHQQAQVLRKTQQKLCGGISEDMVQHLDAIIHFHYRMTQAEQLETAFLAKRAAVNKSVEEYPPPPEMAVLQQELKEIEEKLVFASAAYEKAVWGEHTKIQVLLGTPLLRALQAHRRNQRWYLSDFLKWQCAARGGCCGHPCQCCEKRLDKARGKRVGHCTFSCRCCRGRKVWWEPIVKDWAECEKLFVSMWKLDPDLSPALTDLIINAYVWGLPVGNRFPFVQASLPST